MEDIPKTSKKGLPEAFWVDRELKRGNETESTRRPFKIYGARQAPVRNVGSNRVLYSRKLTRNMCIVCGKEGLYYLAHQKNTYNMYKRIAKSYFAKRDGPLPGKELREESEVDECEETDE